MDESLTLRELLERARTILVDKKEIKEPLTAGARQGRPHLALCEKIRTSVSPVSNTWPCETMWIRKNFKLLFRAGIILPLAFRIHIFRPMRMILPFCPDEFPRQLKECNILSSSLLHWLFLKIPAAVTDHEMSTFNFWASVPLGVHSFIIFIPPRPTEVWCLIPALSFELSSSNVWTHSTRVIFLAVITLLETHQYYFVLIPVFPFFLM